MKLESGRASGKLVTWLRSEIGCGRLAVGEFLPTERELSDQHGLARMTVRRALRELEREGMLTIAPRHGCRVLAAANDPHRGCPVAHVFTTNVENSVLDSIHQLIHNSLRNVVSKHGWSMLQVLISGRPHDEIWEQLRTARAWGVILDVVDSKLLKVIEEHRIPAVLVDAWVEDVPLDSVLQNSYQGGFLAARHLLERGHKHIAWFGPAVGVRSFSRERYGGAAAAVASVGLDIPMSDRFDDEGLGLEAAALRMLSQPGRPKAVLALWRSYAVAVATAARKLKLTLGRDLDLIGWVVNEQYDDYVKEFKQGEVPPAIVWSATEMADMVIARLSARLLDPKLPPMRISVSTKLRMENELQ